MMGFYDIYSQWKNFDFSGFFQKVSAKDVHAALAKNRLTVRDFLTLLSPAADICLESMAREAHRVTVRNFGKVIFLFTPLYLSDYCENQCAYCGFSKKNTFNRKKLSEEEIEEEEEPEEEEAEEEEIEEEEEEEGKKDNKIIKEEETAKKDLEKEKKA